MVWTYSSKSWKRVTSAQTLKLVVERRFGWIPATLIYFQWRLPFFFYWGLLKTWIAEPPYKARTLLTRKVFSIDTALPLPFLIDSPSTFSLTPALRVPFIPPSFFDHFSLHSISHALVFSILSCYKLVYRFTNRLAHLLQQIALFSLGASWMPALLLTLALSLSLFTTLSLISFKGSSHTSRSPLSIRSYHKLSASTITSHLFFPSGSFSIFVAFKQEFLKIQHASGALSSVSCFTLQSFDVLFPFLPLISDPS